MSSATTTTTTITTPDTATCPAFALALEIGNRIASPPQYESSQTAQRVHRWTPRFGHPTDISVLITRGDVETAMDYIRGVVTPVAIVTAVFALWFLVLILAKCCGPRRVGFLSGRLLMTNPRKNKGQSNPDSDHFIYDSSSSHEDNDGNDKKSPPEEARQSTISSNRHQDEQERRKKMLSRIRWIALIANVGVLLCCILTLTIGVAGFANAQDSTVDGIRQAQALADRTINLLDRFALYQNRVVQKVDEYFAETINFSCPNVRDQLCEMDIPENVPDTVTIPPIPTVEGIPEQGQDLPTTDATLPGGYQVPGGYDVPDEVDVPSTMPPLPDGPVEILDIRDRVCDFEGVPLADFLEPLAHMDVDIYYDQVAAGRQDLVELSSDLNNYGDSAEAVKWPFYVATAFILLLVVLDVLLMMSLFFAWRQVPPEHGQVTPQIRNHDKVITEAEDELDSNPAYRSSSETPRRTCSPFGCCVRSMKGWFLVPIFCMVTMICLVLSVVAAAGSIVTSDLCHEDPDVVMLLLLEDQKDKFEGSVAYDFMVYYVSGCLAEQRPREIDNQIEMISEGFKDLSDFLSEIANDIGDFQEICGVETNPISAASRVLLTEFCSSADLLEDVQELFACENWHALYRTVVYDAVCDETSHGLHWLAVCMLGVVFCALVMMTLRLAYYDVDPSEKFSEHAISDRAPIPHHHKMDVVEETDNEPTFGDPTEDIAFSEVAKSKPAAC